MSGSEPITSPDQRKHLSRKGARVGAILVAAMLLVLMTSSREGNVGNIFLVISAGLLVLSVVADWLLRKNGFRR